MNRSIIVLLVVLMVQAFAPWLQGQGTVQEARSELRVLRGNALDPPQALSGGDGLVVLTDDRRISAFDWNLDPIWDLRLDKRPRSLMVLPQGSRIAVFLRDEAGYWLIDSRDGSKLSLEGDGLNFAASWVDGYGWLRLLLTDGAQAFARADGTPIFVYDSAEAPPQHSEPDPLAELQLYRPDAQIASWVAPNLVAGMNLRYTLYLQETDPFGAANPQDGQNTSESGTDQVLRSPLALERGIIPSWISSWEGGVSPLGKGSGGLALIDQHPRHYTQWLVEAQSPLYPFTRDERLRLARLLGRFFNGAQSSLLDQLILDHWDPDVRAELLSQRLQLYYDPDDHFLDSMTARILTDGVDWAWELMDNRDQFILWLQKSGSSSSSIQAFIEAIVLGPFSQQIRQGYLQGYRSLEP